MKTILKISNALLLVGIILLAGHLGSPSARGRVELGDNPANEFIRGDSNDDGILNISDVNISAVVSSLLISKHQQCQYFSSNFNTFESSPSAMKIFQ